MHSALILPCVWMAKLLSDLFLRYCIGVYRFPRKIPAKLWASLIIATLVAYGAVSGEFKRITRQHKQNICRQDCLVWWWTQRVMMLLSTRNANNGTRCQISWPVLRAISRHQCHRIGGFVSGQVPTSDISKAQSVAITKCGMCLARLSILHYLPCAVSMSCSPPVAVTSL